MEKVSSKRYVHLGHQMSSNFTVKWVWILIFLRAFKSHLSIGLLTQVLIIIISVLTHCFNSRCWSSLLYCTICEDCLVPQFTVHTEQACFGPISQTQALHVILVYWIQMQSTEYNFGSLNGNVFSNEYIILVYWMQMQPT